MLELSSYSDEQVVDLVRIRDQEMYKEIVKRYQDKLWRYVFYILRNEAKSADVVQSSFIKAFINLNGFDSKKKFSSWLYRIAHNEAMNEFKRHKKELFFEDIKELTYSVDFIDKLDAVKDRELIDWCLQKMPIKYSEPLVLFYLEEKTYDEISEILKLSMGTVATRINRAKKLMKNICQKKK